MKVNLKKEIGIGEILVILSMLITIAIAIGSSFIFVNTVRDDHAKIARLEESNRAMAMKNAEIRKDYNNLNSVLGGLRDEVSSLAKEVNKVNSSLANISGQVKFLTR